MKELESQLLLLLVLELLPLRVELPADFALTEPEVLLLAVQSAVQTPWLGRRGSGESCCQQKRDGQSHQLPFSR